MASVDNRVVQMTFDNALFERKLSETIKSLDALNQSLKKSDGAQGLKDLDAAAKGIDMASVSKGIEGVSKSFIALSTVAITVLSNIATRAIDTGISIVKSLSLDQVISGFQEYETNMKSIQTILANTKADATTLEDVNGALDELNAYADLTIYNFAEMARNIGTFTAAGVDLDTSVQSIKGIANAAAISGSTSQQASTAMYQLSQAIASGSLKLMDWNSVVNAGMGGEVMQKALFTTGKAMGTLVDVGVDTSFDEWKDAGNSFRESLQEGWITTEVLTTTLKGFSGEAKASELAALGFTDTMIAEFQELGETGVEAATKVRTFTQLMDTAQEAVGSGWSQTFRIVLGDFEEATELFTGISEAFGGWADASADARNSLLQDWKDLGGRATLIEGLKNLFEGLGRVVTAIKGGFRDIFPATTAEQLVGFTNYFGTLMEMFDEAAVRAMPAIRQAVRGLASVFAIVGEVVKEAAKFIGELFGQLGDASGGTVLGFFEDLSRAAQRLKVLLVDDGGIKKFFDGLRDFIKDPLGALIELRDTVFEFFDGLTGGGASDALGVVGDGFEKLGGRFESLKGLLQKVKDFFDPIIDFLGRIGSKLAEVGSYIGDWFAELGQKIADTAGEADFDAVLDVLNVALLGGIGALLGNFIKNGFKFDLGGGLFENIADTFEELTGVLSGMQAKLKAEALLKIAIAIGVLTASVLVLSFIDSAALTKALTAMAVGFGQLVGVMALMGKITANPAQFTIMAVGLIALAGAMLVFAIALKILSTMSWEDIAKGLSTVTALLLALSVATRILGANTGSMIRAGIGIFFIAGAMVLLAAAMKIFATMSWEEIAKGLAGVAGGLALIVAAMNLLPKGMAVKAAGLLLVGAALNLIASSMKIIATLSWEEIGKGLAGIAGGLILIALAMHLMPLSLPVTAAGLLLVGVALNAIALAVQSFGGMSWEELGRGLAGLAGSLLILAVAAYAMSGSILGAVAIGILGASLFVLAKALQEFASISTGDLIKGLIGLAAAFAVIGLAALLLQPVIPAMLALGIAIAILGAGFALFGVGAILVAKSFEIIAKVGGKAIKAIIKGIGAFIAALPGFIIGFVEALGQLAQSLIEVVPVLIELVAVIIQHLLETIIELTPQIVETVITVVLGLIEAIRELFPEFVTLGFDLITEFLTGIRDNIAEIVTLVLEIITEFITAVAENLEGVITAGKDLIIAWISGMAEAYVDIIAAGADALLAFLQGIADNIIKVVDGAFEIVITFINSLADVIEQRRGELADAGLRLIDAIFGGATGFFTDTMIPWVTGIPSEIVTAIGDVFTTLTGKGRELLEGLSSGATERFKSVSIWFSGLPDAIKRLLVGAAGALYSRGKDFIRGLWNGISSLGGWLYDKVTGFVKDMVMNPVDTILGIFSPSRWAAERGSYVTEGLAIGMESMAPMLSKASAGMGMTIQDNFVVDDKELTKPITDIVSSVASTLSALDDIDHSPTIRPVLDLSGVKAGSKALNSILATDQSYATAATIAALPVAGEGDEEAANASREVVFNQTINAPEQLSAAAIYRQTRNQINVAKEELSIP